jgi:hypothetical protein
VVVGREVPVITSSMANQPPRMLLRVMNIPILRRAPWLVYLFMFVVAVGLTIMCVRLKLGDDTLAIVCASVTVGLIVSTGLCVYLSVRNDGTISPVQPRRNKRITVCLRAHLWGSCEEQVVKEESVGTIVTCHICLLDLEKGDKVVELDCGHVFHVDCATNWIKRVAVCPACRFSLPTQITSATTSQVNSPRLPPV